MPRRKRMSRKKSRKNFRSGNRTHKLNTSGRPMRGGIRL